MLNITQRPISKIVFFTNSQHIFLEIIKLLLSHLCNHIIFKQKYFD